jgi:hypothetical protein
VFVQRALGIKEIPCLDIQGPACSCSARSGSRRFPAELAPKYWLATRARLDPAELKAELGPLTVPARSSSQQPVPH